MSEPAFYKDAECRKRNVPREVFVHDPESSDHEVLVRTAKDICRECPVRAECFLYGMENGETGVWGGAWLDVPPEENTQGFN